jgi:hypothetical protein
MNNISQENNEYLSSSLDDHKIESNPLPPLLPRSAWNSQIAFLKVMFRAKKALDKLEQIDDSINSPNNRKLIP